MSIHEYPKLYSCYVYKTILQKNYTYCEQNYIYTLYCILWNMRDNYVATIKLHILSY